MKNSAKRTVRNSSVRNTNSATVRTVAPKTVNDIEEVIETVVENGINYGSSAIKMMNVITILKNGDYTTEQHFYINGYKFRMDEIMRHSIKRYLMAEIPAYRDVEEIDRMLSQNINFKIGSDAPTTSKSV